MARPDGRPPRPRSKSAARSFTGRSESALSRRSSRTSFITAAGASVSDPAEPRSSFTADSVTDGLRDDDDDDDDDDDSSSVSDSPEPRFAARRDSGESLHRSPPTSQDDATTLSTLEEPTPQPQRIASKKQQSKLAPAPALAEAMASPRYSRDDRRFLSPSPTPRKSNAPARESRRFSKASHLTLPYERSEVGDYDYDDGRDRDRRSSTLRPSKSSSRISSQNLEPPFPDRRKSRSRSFTDGGGDRSDSRLSRLAPPLPLGGQRASVRGSMLSGYAPSSPGSDRFSMRDGPMSPNRSLLSPHQRSPRKKDRSDTASIATRTTARGAGRGAASIRSGVAGDGEGLASPTDKVLDPESHVFPGTKIRKHIEPPLTDAMRSVLRQFGGRNMGDHGCNGYPIAVFVGATALDTGSVIHPHVSGGISLYFGAGHPKNMAVVLPDEDRIPRHIPNPKAPTPVSLSRRAELRAAVAALKTVFDLYRGRACAHICIDSAYVAKAWATWIPTWDAQGWPGEEEPEQWSRRRHRDDDDYRSDDDDYTSYSDDDRGGRRRNQRRHRGDRRDGGYASEGGRGARYEDEQRRRRHREKGRRDDRDRDRPRDDWLADDPYGDRRQSRRPGGGGYASDRGSRRGGGSEGGRRRRRRHDDYSDDDDDYSDYDDRRSSSRKRGSQRGGGGGRRTADDDRDDDRRRPGSKRRGGGKSTAAGATSRKLVDEDLLRELADIRYEFALVEQKRIGSAHLYLIDRTHNPADRMARAVAKSEGGLLGATVDHGVGSASVLGDDDDFVGDHARSPATARKVAADRMTLREDDDDFYYDETRSMAEHRVASRIRSRRSIDIESRRHPMPSSGRASLDVGGKDRSSMSDDHRLSQASSVLASAARVRPTAKGRDANGSRLGGSALSVYEEEDEDAADFDDDDGRLSTRTPPSRAELERDDYLARQAEREQVAGGTRSRLAPPSSGRFRDALGSSRGSMDRRRFAASQPDLHEGSGGRRPLYADDGDDFDDRRSMMSSATGRERRGASSGVAGVGAGASRSRNLFPPSPSSARGSLDSRRTATLRSHHGPGLAPEEEGYDWDTRSTASSTRRSFMGRRKKSAAPPNGADPRRPRDWRGKTAVDFEEELAASGRGEKKSGGIFGKLFGKRR
ncbi:uncharacterized protein PFL1_04065 [Pseudozyma flocculosa PF-1]|uniref:RNase H type-1 domain-containing protein n=2 Tax=Pseudozyma flocculosa TaxID=84751 RepID=A0A5C3EUK2_9BASI|nr:uncharacterized protein PFL1_04065 [Pseudozyma flocculosa PF-1]EPQ28238.1 hypothetical protein PFL1_04065 [Pseudozyma flocculosa PF-1]SPO35375.1 uncharacterized protein PSFLO_00846 [Pseudozyma flocculosa]